MSLEWYKVLGRDNNRKMRRVLVTDENFEFHGPINKYFGDEKAVIVSCEAKPMGIESLIPESMRTPFQDEAGLYQCEGNRVFVPAGIVAARFVDPRRFPWVLEGENLNFKLRNQFTPISLIVEQPGRMSGRVIMHFPMKTLPAPNFSETASDPLIGMFHYIIPILDTAVQCAESYRSYSIRRTGT